MTRDKETATERQQRLAKALRDNLRKRKTQARSRAEPAERLVADSDAEEGDRGSGGT